MRNPDQVLTAAQMRAAEDALIAEGTSVDELMQRAGRGAAEWVWRLAAGGSVTVLCGPGNNGGDGYVIAEALREQGLSVSVIAPMAPATDAARTARSLWKGTVSQEPGGAHGSVFVDCLFGSGLARPLSTDHEDLITALVSRHSHAVAVDLPSGIATDSGAIMGRIPPYDLTIALGAWKPAHFLMPALERLGATKLVDIGVELVAGSATVFPRPRFSAPARAAHKYSRGLIGVVAGEMPGAALLAAQAAMRGGAGYVKLLTAVPPAASPAALVVDGTALEMVLADPRWSALLVGPGLGRSEGSKQRLDTVLGRGVPTVIDADALHLLDDDSLEGVDPTRILLTPHEGELARLCSAFDVQGEGKVGKASALSQRTGLTVLAKGPDTILTAPDGRMAYFPPAPSWLASAGTGDVLAGLAASRLASGCDPFAAGGEAVWLHSEAAAMAGPALIADGLISIISLAYARFM
ncbi:MAG: NAD(P)H-hydrate dehydratase [Tsuneonella sp.]